MHLENNSANRFSNGINSGKTQQCLAKFSVKITLRMSATASNLCILFCQRLGSLRLYCGQSVRMERELSQRLSFSLVLGAFTSNIIEILFAWKLLFIHVLRPSKHTIMMEIVYYAENTATTATVGSSATEICDGTQWINERHFRICVLFCSFSMWLAWVHAIG